MDPGNHNPSTKTKISTYTNILRFGITPWRSAPSQKSKSVTKTCCCSKIITPLNTWRQNPSTSLSEHMKSWRGQPNGQPRGVKIQKRLLAPSSEFSHLPCRGWGSNSWWPYPAPWQKPPKNLCMTLYECLINNINVEKLCHYKNRIEYFVISGNIYPEKVRMRFGRPEIWHKEVSATFNHISILLLFNTAWGFSTLINPHKYGQLPQLCLVPCR